MSIKFYQASVLQPWKMYKIYHPLLPGQGGVDHWVVSY